jgi:hypothetical protein
MHVFLGSACCVGNADDGHLAQSRSMGR